MLPYEIIINNIIYNIIYTNNNNYFCSWTKYYKWINTGIYLSKIMHGTIFKNERLPSRIKHHDTVCLLTYKISNNSSDKRQRTWFVCWESAIYGRKVTRLTALCQWRVLLEWPSFVAVSKIYYWGVKPRTNHCRNGDGYSLIRTTIVSAFSALISKVCSTDT